MATGKTLPPIYVDGDSLVIGRGADAIRVKGKDLQVSDGSTHIRGHYPDMYPWATPHRHPEWDVRRSHSCDLNYPPDNIPVAAIPAAIRELKRIAVGGWIVNAPVSDDLLEGAFVRWDAQMETWVAALAGDMLKPSEEPEEAAPSLPLMPESDVAGVPSTPLEPSTPIEDSDPRLEMSPTEAFQPEFMGIVIGSGSVQTHGVVRHAMFNYPARTPLYLSATEPGKATTENTGVFVGSVLVPGVLLLNVYAQVFEKYIALVKEDLTSKITAQANHLIDIARQLAVAIQKGDAENMAAIAEAIEKGQAAIVAGDAKNAEELQKLNDFIVGRLQQLQSFLDTVNRQYNELQQDVTATDERLDKVEASATDGGRGYVVNTIAGREEYKNHPAGTVVFVRDATGDPAVKTGPATYILVGSGADGYWANITSSISIEVDDALEGLQVEQVRAAIEKMHSHDNKDILDKIKRVGDKGVSIDGVTVVKEDGSFAAPDPLEGEGPIQVADGKVRLSVGDNLTVEGDKLSAKPYVVFVESLESVEVDKLPEGALIQTNEALGGTATAVLAEIEQEVSGSNVKVPTSAAVQAYTLETAALAALAALPSTKYINIPISYSSSGSWMEYNWTAPADGWVTCAGSITTANGVHKISISGVLCAQSDFLGSLSAAEGVACSVPVRANRSINFVTAGLSKISYCRFHYCVANENA